MDGGHPAGGSRALVRAIDEAGSFLYADLLSEYGFDLRDIYSEDPPSPKWVLGLVEALPHERRTSCILRDSEESYGWDTNSYLLASIVNSVKEGTFVNMQVRTKKKLPAFDPIEVPGVKKKKSGKPANRFIQMAQAALAKQQRSK